MSVNNSFSQPKQSKSTENLQSNYPKAGDFYYHFKHQDEKGVENYAYKIIGLGFETETEEALVIYQPLYAFKQSHLQELGLNFYVRPLKMFLENVEKPNYSGPRFRLIKDPEIIAKLQEISLSAE